MQGRASGWDGGEVFAHFQPLTPTPPSPVKGEGEHKKDR
jgi:hypothetical protein